MGSIIDLEATEKNLRCEHVKLVVVLANLIVVPISTLLLTICIIKMTCLKKKSLSFLTYIILLIFSAEMMNNISKILQYFKYAFEDKRDDQSFNNDEETPRGIICQIQIFTSIISDYICLSGTLLLTIRCYQVMKSKNRALDKKNVRILSFGLIIGISILLSLIFLFIDRSRTNNLAGLRYDLRDRCNYWCWLEHRTSIACYSTYFILLVLNSVFAFKTNYFLKKHYQSLLKKSLVLISDDDNNNTSGEEAYLAEDDKKRIKALKIMRIKCMIYPWITIGIWSLSTLYRIIDDSIMHDVDFVENPDESEAIERDKFLNNRPLQHFEEALLIFHSILSSFRGILYALSFIIFEGDVAGQFFKKNVFKICCCCRKIENYGLLEDEDNDGSNKEINRISKGTGDSLEDSTEKVCNEEDMNFRKSSASDDVKKNDLNTSDYHYND